MAESAEAHWLSNKDSVLTTTKDITDLVIATMNDYFDKNPEHSALYSFIAVNALARVICSHAAYNGLAVNDLNTGLCEIYDDILQDMRKGAN